MRLKPSQAKTVNLWRARVWRGWIWRLSLFIGLLVPTLAAALAVQLMLSFLDTPNYEGGAAMGLMFSFMLWPLLAGLPFLLVLGIVSGFKLASLQKQRFFKWFFKIWSWALVVGVAVLVLYWLVVIGNLLASGDNAIIVYDLRHDPAVYANMSIEALAAIRFPTAEDRAKPDFKPFPAKELSPGNCPAVAPLSALTPEAESRIHLTRATAARHLTALQSGDLIEKLRTAMKPREYDALTDVDARLYEGFLGGQDKIEASKVRTASPATLTALKPHFADPRLPELFARYKARNYPEILTPDEQAAWTTYRTDRLQADWPAFAASLEAAGASAKPETMSLLTDLQLWAESILPEPLAHD